MAFENGAGVATLQVYKMIGVSEARSLIARFIEQWALYRHVDLGETASAAADNCFSKDTLTRQQSAV